MSIKKIEDEVREFMAKEVIKTILAPLNHEDLGALSELLIENFSNLCMNDRSGAPALTSDNNILTRLEKLDDAFEDRHLRGLMSDVSVELKSFIKVTEEERVVLKEEIRSLKMKLCTTESHLRSTEDQFSELTKKIQANEALLLASDIATLFIKYIFEPTYSQACGAPRTWKDFTNDIGLIEMKLNTEQLQRGIDGKCALSEQEVEAELNRFYQPVQQHFKVNLRDLRALNHQRAALAHTEHRSASDQRLLIEKGHETEENISDEFKKVLHTMLAELQPMVSSFRRLV